MFPTCLCGAEYADHHATSINTQNFSDPNQYTLIVCCPGSFWNVDTEAGPSTLGTLTTYVPSTPVTP